MEPGLFYLLKFLDFFFLMFLCTGVYVLALSWIEGGHVELVPGGLCPPVPLSHLPAHSVGSVECSHLCVVFSFFG